MKKRVIIAAVAFVIGVLLLAFSVWTENEAKKDEKAQEIAAAVKVRVIPEYAGKLTEVVEILTDCELTPAEEQALLDEYVADAAKATQKAVTAAEKAAKTAALESGGCIVQVIPEGMGRYFKPSGRDFDVCAAGRLLVLSPFAPEPGGQVERSHYGKARFEALNLASEAIADFAVNVKRVE